MKTTFFALFAFLFLHVQGCSDNKSDKRRESPDELTSLLNEVRSLQESAQKGVFLRSSSDRDRSAYLVVLHDINIGLLKLKNEPDSKDALELLYTAVVTGRKLPLLAEDQSRMEELLNRLSLLLSSKSQSLGLVMADLYWRLFSYNFSDGIEPFTSFAEKGPMWERDIALGKSFARIKGYDVTSWLLSPSFNLTGITNPKVRIRHLINLDRNTGSYASDLFDRAQIVASAFKVVISTDYKKGDPSAATWQELDISPMPSSIDFHTVVTPEIDISPWIGENVTIAFHYDFPSNKMGHHYALWQIEEMDLLGSGDLGNCCEARDRKLLEQQFNSASFSPFFALTPPAESANWEMAAYNGTNYAQIYTQAKTTDAWLLSPRLDLSQSRDLTLSVYHKSKFANTESMKIMASLDFEGGDPKESTWTEVPWAPEGFTPKDDKWNTLPQIPLDISFLSGKKFVLAFVVTADKKTTLGWQINNYTIYGSGALGLVEKDGLKFTGDQKPQTIIYEHQFGDANTAPYQGISFASPDKTWEPFPTPPKPGTFLKIDSRGTREHIWLISPKMTLPDVAELNVKYTGVTTNPDWRNIKFLLSTNYQGGDPREANVVWTALDHAELTFIPTTWTDFTSKRIDLSTYAGQNIVLAWQFQSPAGGAYTGFEIGKLTISGSGEGEVSLEEIAVSMNNKIVDKALELTPNAPINTPPAQQVKLGKTLFSHTFKDGMGDMVQGTIEGNPAQFKLKLNTVKQEQAAEISGYSKPTNFAGTAVLTTPKMSFKAGEVAAIKVTHVQGFYNKAEDRADKLLTIVYAEVPANAVVANSLATLNWQELNFSTEPKGYDSKITDIVETEWLNLPATLAGKDFVIGFRYKSTETQAPRWTLFDLKISLLGG